MQTHINTSFKSQLADYVTAIWEVKGERNINEIILPQGVVEIVFNFAEAITGYLPNSRTPFYAPRCFIQGINTHVTHASYTGLHHLFGVRLQPHRVADLVGVPSYEASNTNIDLGLINPQFIGLWNRLGDAVSFEKRIEILEEEFPVLEEFAHDRSKALSQLFVSGTVDNFQSVDNLAKQVCYSTRQLNRVSHQLFGLSAEELTVYKKYLDAVKLVHHGKNTLTDIAYSTGFYDQSHFCRVFKDYTGMTAKEYRKAKSDLPFHLFS